MRIKSAGRSLDAGDVLTCTSDGYPEPSYSWTDDDGVVVSSESVVNLTVSYSQLTCTATGDLSTDCSASTTIYSSSDGTINPLKDGGVNPLHFTTQA